MTDADPPTPLNGTVCGLPGAVSVIVAVATLLPLADGVNFRLTRQESPGLNVLGTLQVPVPPNGKSIAFAPVTVMALTLNGALPEFEMVKVETALVAPTVTVPKLMDVGLSVIAGVPPVPLRGIWCGLPEALSVSVMVADRAPAACGVKTTPGKEQLAPAVKVVTQLFEAEKSAAFAPEIVTVEMTSDAVPELVTVITTGELEVLTGTAPKFTGDGLMVTAGTPAPTNT